MQAPMVENPPADSLVRRAQQGDPGSFEELYRSHVDRIYRLCLRLSADAGRAEELTQDAFVRAWEKLATWRGESGFSTWLHRVAVNVVMDRLRADKRRAAWMTTTGDLSAFDREAGTLKPGARIDLEKAIALLPAGARTAFVLHDVEGYRHEEIAEMTGMAEGTSKSQLHRARRFLREVLEP